MKIGFIGLGNMAEAMIGGMLGTGGFRADEIVGSAKTKETADRVCGKYGITAGTDNRETAKQADVLILAVKPVFLAEVIAEIREFVDGENMLVISIAAGKTIEWIEREFGMPLRIVRCMPNTPAMVGEGCTCVCLKETFSDRRVYDGDRELALRSHGQLWQGEHPSRAADGRLYRRGGERARVCLSVYRGDGGWGCHGGNAQKAGV